MTKLLEIGDLSERFAKIVESAIRQSDSNFIVLG